jgi:hypothetical protein
LEARDRDDRSVPGRLLHELRGYLTACGRELIPLDMRCSLAWRRSSSFNSVRDLWITNFFQEGERLLFAVPLPLSAKPRIAVPLVSLAGGCGGVLARRRFGGRHRFFRRRATGATASAAGGALGGDLGAALE